MTSRKVSISCQTVAFAVRAADSRSGFLFYCWGRCTVHGTLASKLGLNCSLFVQWIQYVSVQLNINQKSMTYIQNYDNYRKKLLSTSEIWVTDTVVQFSQSFVSMHACAAAVHRPSEVKSSLTALRNAIEVREGTISKNIFIHICIFFLWICLMHPVFIYLFILADM